MRRKISASGGGGPSGGSSVRRHGSDDPIGASGNSLCFQHSSVYEYISMNHETSLRKKITVRSIASICVGRSLRWCLAIFLEGKGPLVHNFPLSMHYLHIVLTSKQAGLSRATRDISFSLCFPMNFPFKIRAKDFRNSLIF